MADSSDWKGRKHKSALSAMREIEIQVPKRLARVQKRLSGACKRLNAQVPSRKTATDQMSQNAPVFSNTQHDVDAAEQLELTVASVGAGLSSEEVPESWKTETMQAATESLKTPRTNHEKRLLMDLDLEQAEQKEKKKKSVQLDLDLDAIMKPAEPVQLDLDAIMKPAEPVQLDLDAYVKPAKPDLAMGSMFGSSGGFSQSSPAVIPHDTSSISTKSATRSLSTVSHKDSFAQAGRRPVLRTQSTFTTMFKEEVREMEQEREFSGSEVLSSSSSSASEMVDIWLAGAEALSKIQASMEETFVNVNALKNILQYFAIEEVIRLSGNSIPHDLDKRPSEMVGAGPPAKNRRSVSVAKGGAMGNTNSSPSAIAAVAVASTKAERASDEARQQDVAPLLWRVPVVLGRNIYKMGAQEFRNFFIFVSRMVFEKTGCNCTFIFERAGQYSFSLASYDLLGPSAQVKKGWEKGSTHFVMLEKIKTILNNASRPRARKAGTERTPLKQLQTNQKPVVLAYIVRGGIGVHSNGGVSPGVTGKLLWGKVAGASLKDIKGAEEGPDVDDVTITSYSGSTSAADSDSPFGALYLQQEEKLQNLKKQAPATKGEFKTASEKEDWEIKFEEAASKLKKLDKKKGSEGRMAAFRKTKEKKKKQKVKPDDIVRQAKSNITKNQKKMTLGGNSNAADLWSFGRFGDGIDSVVSETITRTADTMKGAADVVIHPQQATQKVIATSQQTIRKTLTKDGTSRYGAAASTSKAQEPSPLSKRSASSKGTEDGGQPLTAEEKQARQDDFDLLMFDINDPFWNERFDSPPGLQAKMFMGALGVLPPAMDLKLPVTQLVIKISNCVCREQGVGPVQMAVDFRFKVVESAKFVYNIGPEKFVRLVTGLVESWVRELVVTKT